MARRTNLTAIDAGYNPAIDTGCEFSPSCLSCPFRLCRYDHPRGIPGMLAEHRKARARELSATGVPPLIIARELSIHVRTVYRDLSPT